MNSAHSGYGCWLGTGSSLRATVVTMCAVDVKMIYESELAQSFVTIAFSNAKTHGAHWGTLVMWFHISAQVIDIVPQEKSILCILQKYFPPAGSYEPFNLRAFYAFISSTLCSLRRFSRAFDSCHDSLTFNIDSDLVLWEEMQFTNGNKLKFFWCFFSPSIKALPLWMQQFFSRDRIVRFRIQHNRSWKADSALSRAQKYMLKAIGDMEKALR